MCREWEGWAGVGEVLQRPLEEAGPAPGKVKSEKTAHLQPVEPPRKDWVMPVLQHYVIQNALALNPGVYDCLIWGGGEPT